MRKSILMLFLLTIVSCSSKVDDSPREIKSDRDVCHVCKMGLADQRYTAQMIDQHGQVLWFDDIGCLVKLMESDEWPTLKGDDAKLYIGDCDSGEWIDARKAHYRYGDRTPMGYGYGAMKSAPDSTYTYVETIQRIKDGKTMRDQFMKEMGKGKHKHK